MTGARAIVVILWILCAAACGARAPVAKAAGPPHADDGWARFGLASDGMSAMFSTIPEEGWWESTESEVRGLLAGEENGLQLIMQSYRHRSIIEQVVTEESLAGWLDGLVPHAERREEIKQGELLGRSIEGTDAKGRWCNARAFHQGNTTYALIARAPEFAVDRGSANRFFDSFELRPPLRIYASVEGHFTLAVPTSAKERKLSAPVPGAVCVTFSTGPYAELPFVFGCSFPVSEAMKALEPAQALERMILSLTTPANAIPFGKRSDLTIRGAKGREYAVRSELPTAGGERRNLIVRARIFRVGERFYQVGYASDVASPFSPEVTTLLDSFRWASAPLPESRPR
jgi:hypothetical protein